MKECPLKILSERQVLIQMNYKIYFRKKAMKFIEKQDANQKLRIYRAIKKLPMSGDIKKMAGSDSIYRLRVGDYRILYELSLIDYTLTLVDIFDADNRGQIYK